MGKAISKYLDAFYADVNRLLDEHKKLEAVLKKTPTDAKAKKRVAEIKSTLAMANVEKLQEKAIILDRNNLKTMLKSELGI